MIEKIGVNEQTRDHLERLASELFSGKINREMFLDEVFKLDQDDPGRKSAVAASHLLMSEEVAGLFQDSEEETSFYNVRSISFFHKAQIDLFAGRFDVLKDLNQALLDATQSGEDYEDWTHYIKATIAYLQNDIETLRDLFKQIVSNKELVKNFIRGLEERGEPDYLSDYSCIETDNV